LPRALAANVSASLRRPDPIYGQRHGGGLGHLIQRELDPVRDAPERVSHPASTQPLCTFSTSARNKGAAADSSPELITYGVPVSRDARARGTSDAVGVEVIVVT
jgi:hypothetical protein